MPDMERVIGHLNDCMEASRRDNTWVFVRKDIVEDALSLLKEQEEKIRQLRLALDIVKGTCKGIKSGGGQFADMPIIQSAT